IGASVLRPTIAGKTIVGPALTVRNILQRINPIEGARQHVNRMAEFEAHNLAQKGDVLVIQGVADVSNMGGIAGETGKGQGEIGAIVQGGVRDVAHSRALDYPVWASDITPVTGKWRIETVEINGPVQIGEVRVAAGDLVVADDTGVCFIPRDVVLEVLDAAEQKAKAEAGRCKAVDDGVPVPGNARATYRGKRGDRYLKARHTERWVTVGTATEGPLIFALAILDRQVVDAGDAPPHQAVLVELPVLVAIAAKPVAGIIVPFICKAHSDPVVAVRPHFLDQPIIEL